VAAPTGAGKTLIAEYAIEKCVAEGRRAIYTAPIKALSNQKFRDFKGLYGDRIGIKTGDVTINPDAQITLMTTEIFRNTIFESPEALDAVHYCVFDEIHYLDDIERGTVWEESIIFAPPHIRFLCLSATVPNVDAMADWIRHVRPEVPLEVIREDKRPVPLKTHLWVPGLGVKSLDDMFKLERAPDYQHTFRRFDRRELNPGSQRARLVDHLVSNERLPVLWFAFNRRECEEFSSMVGRSLLTGAERAEMLGLYDDLLARFGLGKDSTTEQIRLLVGKGTAFHHAGLLPTLKEVVERLFTTGLVKLLFATETFAVGVNMPARTVVFNSLTKYDGRRLGYIKAREFSQMAGRAGRRGKDPVGYVYAIAEWPHERAQDLDRVIRGRIEAIRSQFNLSYSTLLTLHERLGDRLPAAAEKSFSNFQHRRPEKNERSWEHKAQQMQKKLSILRSLGYLKEKELTTKGRFAKNIQGYEMQVTELLFGGVLRQLSEDELNVVFNAITYESKKSDWHRSFESPRQRWLRKLCYQKIDPILHAEDRLDLEDRTKELDFRLASAVNAWSRGCEWAALESHTSASDGDLVRSFRLSLQLMRNTQYALPKGDPLRDKMREAVARMNRDVVDAERQLRLGVEEPGAPAAERGPSEDSPERGKEEE
jgi:superfamily II RNA helicase